MKNLLLFIFMFCVAVLWAQENSNTLSNEEFFTQSELVIEGQFTKIVHTYDTKGNGKFEDCIAIKAIIVKKVYKGDPSLAGTTIFVVQKGAHLGSEKDYETEIVIDGISGIREICDAYFVPFFLSKNGINFAVNSFTPLILFFLTSGIFSPAVIFNSKNEIADITSITTATSPATNISGAI